MKRWVRSRARKYGYEIRKAPPPNFQSVSVFDLALHYMMATGGDALTFIEVGANDGLSGDPMREYILKHPWRGVLVEPQPDVFARLQANYPAVGDRIAFENVAVSRSREPIAMYRLPLSSPKSTIGTATVASSNQKIAARQLDAKLEELEKIMVPTASLDDLVAKHGMEKLDVLQLDTEGFDWEVLQSLDLTRTRPRLIRFEHGHLTPQTIAAMTQHLNANGYDLSFGGYEQDSVALRKDLIQA
jgi:FkbM family methyltransferase